MHDIHSTEPPPDTPEDHRRNSRPIAWKVYSDDPATKNTLNALIEELGISLRLMGKPACPPVDPVSLDGGGAVVPPPNVSPLLPAKRKRGRPVDPLAYSDVAFRFLLNLWQAGGFDETLWVFYSRTESDYTKRSNFPDSVSYERVIKVASWLSEIGWVEHVPGLRIWAKGVGRRSMIRASAALLDRLAGLKPIVVQEPFTDSELIRLKDSDKHLVAYVDTPDVVVMREKLRRINAQISKSTLGFNMSHTQKRAMVLDLRARDATIPDLSRIQLYRSFNEDFEHGGRYYGGWWIGLPSQYREQITIDGEATREPDFSRYHLSMVYSIEGLPIPADCYDIGWHEKYAPMVKKFINVLLYAKDEAEGFMAMLDFREDDIREMWKACDDVPQIEVYGRKEAVLVPMLQDIKKTHAAVAHYFGTGKSTQLQFRDSRIAELVLQTSVWLGITCLPVHDSFIVPASQADYFTEHMKMTFDASYGQSIAVKNKN